MAIELIDKIKPKNNGSFPMVDSDDVEMPDGSRLSGFARVMASGKDGQFAVSNGKGGITWLTVGSADEEEF